jgi:predicted phage terminase large subunit-like protein
MLDNSITKETLNKLSLEQLRLIERHKCQTDLLYLIKEYLGASKVINEEMHGEVAAILKSLTDGWDKTKEKEAVIQLPRGHLKTALITIAWTIQRILCDQNITIMIVSSVYATALEWVQNIQDYLLDERLVKLFPEILCATEKDYKQLGLSWKEDVVNVKRTKVTRGPTVRVIGIDGSKAGKHADIVLFDDIMDENNSDTAEAILRVIRQYKHLSCVLNPGGLRVIVGTRYGISDFYSWLEENNYTIHAKSCVINSKNKPCSVLDDDAVPIFPERFSIELLKKKRTELGAYLFSCQYENNPLPAESITFKESWMRTYKIGDEPRFRRLYILCDPAMSQSKKSDETVLSVVGQPVDNEKPLYVLKSKAIGFKESKGDVQAVIDALFDEYVYYSKSHEVVVGIETVGFQTLLRTWIQKEQIKRAVHFSIKELKAAGRHKYARIQRLQPLFENNGILLNPENCKGLIQQLLSFPSSTHDDHPDALAYLLDIMVSPAQIQVFNYLEKNNAFDDPNDLENVLLNLDSGSNRSWLGY